MAQTFQRSRVCLTTKVDVAILCDAHKAIDPCLIGLCLLLSLIFTSLGSRKTSLGRKTPLKRGGEPLKRAPLKRTSFGSSLVTVDSQPGTLKSQSSMQVGTLKRSAFKKAPFPLPGSNNSFGTNSSFKPNGQPEEGVSRAKKGSTLKAKSKKQKERDGKYFKSKSKYLEEHLLCEVPGCGEEASDLHHTKGRVGKLYWDMKFFMACCRIHHGEIHANEIDSVAKGWKVSRHSSDAKADFNEDYETEGSDL